MTTRHVLLLTVLSIGLMTSNALAQNAVRPETSKQSFHHVQVRASEIDPRVRAYPEIDFLIEKDGKPQDIQHACFDPNVPQQGRLVIWLMGYNDALADRVTGYGLHFIQVHYANRWFSKLSPLAGDNDQHLGNIRLEAAIGEDITPSVSIHRPDSIAERSLQLVKHLAKNHPEGNWGQFLTDDGNDLNWEKVTLAGASHGATTATRFAKHQRVGRVVMLCGPRDQLESWQALPSATPANRYFGFSHTLDGGWTGDHYCRSWLMLGLNEFGPVVDVDRVPPPFKNTRRLITSADVGGSASRAHGAVIPGRKPLTNSNGEVLYEEVWRYLFMHPVDEVGQPTPPEPDCQLDLRPNAQ